MNSNQIKLASSILCDSRREPIFYPVKSQMEVVDEEYDSIAIPKQNFMTINSILNNEAEEPIMYNEKTVMQKLNGIYELYQRIEKARTIRDELCDKLRTSVPLSDVWGDIKSFYKASGLSKQEIDIISQRRGNSTRVTEHPNQNVSIETHANVNVSQDIEERNVEGPSYRELSLMSNNPIFNLLANN